MPLIIAAVATPVVPPDGAEDIPTVGIDVYPPPLFVTVIRRIPPKVEIPTIAVAVDPAPTNVSVWEDPISVEIPSSFCPSYYPPVRKS